MVMWCKEIRIFATEFDRLFQERQHRRKVVRRSRSRPGIIGGGAKCSGASYVVWWDLERFFEVASCDTDQARVIRVRGKTLSKGRERVEQPTHRRVDKLLVCEPVQRRALATSRRSAAPRHVGGLIPAKEGARGNKIVDLEQTRLELIQHGLV